MKTIILLRHGKAESYYAKSNDFDRELAEEGRRNAMEMGIYIRDEGFIPDLICSSGAARAFETAMLAAERMNYSKDKIIVNNNLYLCSASAIFYTFSKLSNEINSCMIVAHNPGLTELINELGVKMDNLPTASAISFSFNVDSWKNILDEEAKYLWVKLAEKKK